MAKATAHSPGTSQGTARAQPTFPVPYTLTGNVAVGTSPSVVPHLTTSIVGFSAHLDTPGTTPTTVGLLTNDHTTTIQVTIAAGATYAYTTFDPIQLDARIDSYAVTVTAAGTSAAGLGGEIEMSMVPGAAAPGHP